MKVQMHAEHEALRVKAREYAALLDGPLPQDMSNASKLRLEFASMFRSHIIAEKNYAEACLVKADSSVHTLMKEFSRCFNQFYFDYSEHLYEWRLDRIKQDWKSYGNAVRQLQRRFLHLLEWEETEILPALARTE